MIKTENLVIGYDNKVVLRNVNINITEGEYVCIVGQNGSGKSTLLKTMSKHHSYTLPSHEEVYKLILSTEYLN